MQLILNIPVANIETFKDIESIDEVVDIIEQYGNKNFRHVPISEEEEFWGHRSNLQAWISHGYDTRILHRSFAFPLLKKLTKLGDSKAKKVYINEITYRFLTGNLNIIIFLLDGHYLKELTGEELQVLFTDFDFNKILNEDYKKLLPVLTKLGGLKSSIPRQILKTQVEKLFLKNDLQEIRYLIKKDYLKLFSEEELDRILEKFDFTILTKEDTRNSFPLLKALADTGNKRAKEKFLVEFGNRMSNLKNYGIGPRVKKKLNNIGIMKIEDLARNRVRHLINAGIGESTANKIVKTAREAYMDMHGFYEKYGLNHPIAKKYVLQGVDFHDSIILEKIQENIKNYRGISKWRRELHNFNFFVDQYEDEYYRDDKIREAIKMEYIDPTPGICYKIDENGKVVLLWSGYYGAPDLVRIPDDLMELSHLKYLSLICDFQGFETLPNTIKSNDIFEVKTNPMEVDESDIYYEITIIRKGILDGYDNVMDFLIEEAFKRYS